MKDKCLIDCFSFNDITIELEKMFEMIV